MTQFLDLEELRLFLSDSAPEEIDLADPDQVDFEARRLLLLADTYRELARPAPRRLTPGQREALERIAGEVTA